MTKTFLAGVLVLCSCSAYANELKQEDFSWQDTCEYGEMPGISKIPTNVFFVEKWFDKAYEAYTTEPCDKPTLKYLSSPTTTTEVRVSLAGMRSRVRDKQCRDKLKELLLQVDDWVKELKTLIKTNQCINPLTQGMSTYLVNVSSINVRADPLTATKSVRLDILKDKHHLILKTRIIGNRGNEWGYFLYELHGQQKFGWLNMKYTRPVVFSQ